MAKRPQVPFDFLSPLKEQFPTLEMVGFDGRPDPDSVLPQEAAGTRRMVTSDQLPVDMDKEGLKKLGFEILGPTQDDALFIDVKFPTGWTKRANPEDGRTTDIFDAAGNRRAYVWYKAASYDRKAYGVIRRRFEVQTRNFNDYTIGVGWVLDVKIPGATVSVFQTEDVTYESDREGVSTEAQDALRAACAAWLDVNYPDWRDPTAYWDVKVPKAGKFPPWNQRTR